MGLRVVEGLQRTDRVIIRGLARIQPDMLVEPEAGEIKPAAEQTPATAKPLPESPNGNPEQGAQPGTGGNASPADGARGRAPDTAAPQKK